MLKSSFNKSDLSKLFWQLVMMIYHHQLLKILGVILDCHLNLDEYINATCKSSFFNIIFLIVAEDFSTFNGAAGTKPDT